jgi:hypothetical protein
MHVSLGGARRGARPPLTSTQDLPSLVSFSGSRRRMNKRKEATRGSLLPNFLRVGVDEQRLAWMRASLTMARQNVGTGSPASPFASRSSSYAIAVQNPTCVMNEIAPAHSFTGLPATHPHEMPSLSARPGDGRSSITYTQSGELRRGGEYITPRLCTRITQTGERQGSIVL